VSTILSPAESLGLSGAALDGRLRNAVRLVSDDVFARIADRLLADAIEEEIIYERDGTPEPIRVMLRPLPVQRDQLTYVHHVCLRIAEAFRRMPDWFIEDAEIRRIVSLNPDEERWIRDMWKSNHGRSNAVFGRLDAVSEFSGAGWQDTLKFMEPNLSGVGGIHYAPVAEQVVMRDVVPVLLAHDPELSFGPLPDQRDLFAQVLIDHARAVGRSACRLSFVEPKYVHEGPAEQSSLIRYLSRRYGLSITHADPRELVVRDGEVYYEDKQVDVAYRDYEVRELIRLERELGRPLDGMRLLFKENRVVSSLVGDFDHKSGFEILTDPHLAERFFSLDDCRLFHRHVLWTRLVSERRTTLPDHKDGDLLDYIRRHREQLVLKPNRGYGGTGVALGAAIDQGEWETLLDDAAAKASDPERAWVVQAATRLPVAEFPVVGPERRVHNEPYYAVMGFTPTDNGLGVLCRVSQKQVVNVAQHGGMAALLLTEPLKDLRIPRRRVAVSTDARRALRLQIAELRHFEQTIALLEWDEETKLPLRGRLQRGEQLATLEGTRHALLASDFLGDLIEEVAARLGGDSDMAREIFLLRRERRQAIAVPEGLVRRLANAKSQALAGWEEARETGTFSTFGLPFAQLLALVRERAEYLAHGGELYDALLDHYEPGMTRARLEPVLRDMRERLVPLVREAAEASAPSMPDADGARFPEAGQWDLSRRVLTAVGFDFERGRLDRSTHPFTMMVGEDDVRLTSHVDESDPWSALLTTLHEAGHALYDQGFAAADRDTLLAVGASAGMHEGQARLWENHVGRDRAFIDFILPHLRTLFPGAAAGFEPESLWRAINRVRPGANRVGADEMSYHLHIVLRYELEIALLSGEIAVSALPESWNDRSAGLLGVRPRSDREGVLQDVHWAVGMFGYFPTYTIGSLYAAQLIEAYRASGDLSAEIRAGAFSPLLGWLRKTVHGIGSRRTAEEIMIEVTGRGLDTSAFFAHVASPERAWNRR
jgi:carboxypeptidase Taq